MVRNFLYVVFVASLVFFLTPTSFVDRVLFKKVPENAVQLGRRVPPSAEPEKSPVFEFRDAVADKVWAFILHDPNEEGGRFSLTYEGTRQEFEGRSRIPSGAVAEQQPPVWATISTH